MQSIREDVGKNTARLICPNPSLLESFAVEERRFSAA